MDEASAVATRYWCHACSRVVVPFMELEIKCPDCGDGFVEEMGSTDDNHGGDEEFESDRDRALSLWAPVLLGMMGNHRRRRRTIRHLGFDDDDDESYIADIESRRTDESELDREIESIIRRRRRSSATILQLLQGIRDRAGISSESERLDSGRDRDEARDGDRERERVILINPFGQTIVVQGSSSESSQTSNLIGSLGDYFIGPGLDLLLQHLSENDPNRYGTPPARKEAVEAMPIVKIKEKVQCSVCLDDLEIGAEAREMPCKHKFHEACILPWLELHSSCPVCRFQLPAEEVKNNDSERNGEEEPESEVGNIGNDSAGDEADENPRNESGRRFQFPWLFNSLFSSSSSGSRTDTAGNSTSSSSLSPSSSNVHEGASHGNDED
ncbi:hypothetical protein MLD38_040321 [Melastoma candidum]|uniref:Uncharacterized protein n=1 Tax=Melastoma candidum TaxID=119954 RepID=A0ACB9L687_9MYRT|nr:hypothetical protein MLD38_040321 [Melastoma candidum]